MKLSGPQLIARMALLAGKRIEIERDGKIVIGWELEPDELMVPNEGLEMIRAIERHARLNFPQMRARMLKAANGKL